MVTIGADLPHRLVVAQPALHVRHDLAQRLERQCVKLVKAQPQQDGDDGLSMRQHKGGKFALHFSVVLVNAEHPANAV